MRELTLTKEGALKLRRLEIHLDGRDVVESISSCIPGEWCRLFNEKSGQHYVAMVNPSLESNRTAIRIVCSIHSSDNRSPEEILGALLESALKRRRVFSVLDGGCRLVYGENDSLPGLIVDHYRNAILIQINTAGMDRFRSWIVAYFREKYPSISVCLLDHADYRSVEGLPDYKSVLDIDVLDIDENGFSIRVPVSNMQKVGYYYDHRENRLRFEQLLHRLRTEKGSGLDLFCYAGSWGLHLARGGVQSVACVDQGDMESTVLGNFERNGLQGRFIRRDVFAYLEEQRELKRRYDVICSDPPAFAKGRANRIKAIEGYQKLHQRIMDVLAPGGVLAIASCTQVVSFNELADTVDEAATKKGRRIQMIDMGLQGPDHPMRTFHDRSHYLKYMAFLVD